MHLSTVQIPTNFGLDWNWSSIQFLISNPDQIELFIYIIGILYWDQLVCKLGEFKEFEVSEPIRSSDNDSTGFWPPGSLHTLSADGHI